MSGPMPAGSPSVSAKDRDIAGLSVLDHRLAAQFLDVALGVTFELLLHQLLAHLALGGRVVGVGLLLAAQRIDLDALLR